MIPYSPYSVLADLGFIKIYSWGLMTAIGFFVGTLLAAREGEKRGIDNDVMYGLIAWIILGSIIGARIGYVFFSDYVVSGFFDLLRVWEGGMSLHGGLIGGIVFSWAYIRKRKLDFWKISDIIAPSIAIGFAIGRIGCFLRGCCYGIAANIPWGVEYLGEIRHPTQLYSSIALFGMFFLLVKLREKKRFDGYVFLSFVMIYSSFRFFIEFIRAETIMVWVLTTGQIASIIGFAFGLGFYLFLRKRH